jgi:hypothetical protein
MGWNYAMQAVIAMVFQVLCFSHECQIVTIDQSSFSLPNPSSGTSMVLMIYNMQPKTINLVVSLFPSFMGTFDYPPPSSDVNIISVVPDQPRAAILVLSFRTCYFNDPWNLPSPSTSMEGTRHPGMAIPLSTTEVAYNIIQQTLANPDLTPPHELDPVFKPIWAHGSLSTQDSLDFILPSDEVILEALTCPDRLWDYLHHRSYFLPKLKRIEVGEFVSTMNGDNSCLVNPLATHGVYSKGNMESISSTIPIDISKIPLRNNESFHF